MKKSLLAFILLFVFNGSKAQLQEANFQWSFTGSYSYSFINPTGNLSNYLPSYGGSSYGLEINYKNFLLNAFYFNGGLSSLQADFNFNGNWFKGTPTKLKYPQLLIGYSFVNKDLISVYPLVGLSQITILPSSGYISKNKEYNDMTVYDQFVPEIGVSVDLMYSPQELFNHRKNSKFKQYLHFRIRLLYEFCNFNKTSNLLKGNMYTIHIGCGIVTRRLKKIPRKG